ncbi:hypothetical protein A4X13_0g5719, partial [Tilletia indica]
IDLEGVRKLALVHQLNSEQHRIRLVLRIPQPSSSEATIKLHR